MGSLSGAGSFRYLSQYISKTNTLLCEVLLRFKEHILRDFSCRSLLSIPTQVRWRLERLWDLSHNHSLVEYPI